MNKKTEDAFKKLLGDFYIDVIFPELEKLHQEIVGVDGKLAEFKDGFYDRMDQAMGELKTTREEQIIMNQRLDDIEATPTVAHELKKKKAA